MKYLIILTIIVNFSEVLSKVDNVCMGNFTFDDSEFLCNNLCMNPFQIKCVRKEYTTTRCECYGKYAVDKDNNCRLKTECPYYRPTVTTIKPTTSKCSKNEVFSKCKPKCIATCKNKKPKCKSKCDGSGCICKKGYVRNDKNKCVLIKKCPKTQSTKKCGKNEKYRRIPYCLYFCKDNKSDRRCRDQKGKHACVIILFIILIKVSSREICKGNLTYDSSLYVCAQNCSNLNLKVCSKEILLESRCTCIDDYAYDNNGNCILVSDCPGFKGITVTTTKRPTTIRCGSNTMLSKCFTKCNPTCKNKYPKCSKTRNCKDIGCICKKNYVSINDKCVPVKQCTVKTTTTAKTTTTVKETPISCGVNMEWTWCSPTCTDTCEGMIGQCSDKCDTATCVCKAGYVLGRGKCIPRDQCHTTTPQGTTYRFFTTTPCPPNMFFNYCPSSCPETCEGIQRCSRKCGSMGCSCNKGFVLHNGVCVRRELCNMLININECKVHERWSDCPPKCPETCEGIRPCSRMCAPAGCICEKGYVRNGTDCIPRENCFTQTSTTTTLKTTTKKSCVKNQKWRKLSRCIEYCVNKSVKKECKDRKGESDCFLYIQLIFVLVHFSNGSKSSNAEKCNGNLTLSSKVGKKCDQYCLNLKEESCISSETKKKLCQCSGDYAFDSNLNCIKKKDCPKQVSTTSKPSTLKCRTNEVLSKCVSQCLATCQNKKPKCPKDCGESGCVCKKNYVLHKGKCILNKKCPKVTTTKKPTTPKCSKNMEWSTCPPLCLETCAGLPDKCPNTCGDPKCICKSGFVLNGTDCILKSKCPVGTTLAPIKTTKFCGENMIWATCPSKCPETCEGTKPCVRMCDPPRCVCKPGYVLNMGICVPRESCVVKTTTFKPTTVKCGANMEWSNCTRFCPETCFIKRSCSIRCGPPGCQCVKGFVRYNGNCIKKTDCPATTQRPTTTPSCPDKMEWSTCPTKCPRKCSNLNPTCSKDCAEAACICKKGFVLYHQRCVPESKCPSQPITTSKPSIITCGKNMIWQECPSKCEESCFEKLPSFCDLSCDTPRCVCMPGYTKYLGSCIPVSMCPSLTTSKPNKCSKNSKYQQVPDCVRYCKEGTVKKYCSSEYKNKRACVCVEGYIKDKMTKECIPRKECKKQKLLYRRYIF
uniref:TIL domain-containing protein n=1 Tax=Parastrongyloides trichosuri TaxID=131310 RepID=A0A0N4ZGD6_PARTI